MPLSIASVVGVATSTGRVTGRVRVPELPEVEAAARLLARAAVGKRIADVRLLHPALYRRVDPAAAAALRGRRLDHVERRGKHQLLTLDDQSVVHVHFRMTGDWVLGRSGEPAAPHARAIFEFTDGTWIALSDPRALATISVYPAGAGAPLPALGPEATDPTLTPEWLAAALRKRRLAIKLALLDQRVVAGLGNIYAAEALWHAEIDPTTPAASLTLAQLGRLIDGMRRTLGDASEDPGRYARGESTQRLNVYGRAGEPCRRCGAPVVRIVQGSRSTYYCGHCQLTADAVSRTEARRG